MPRDDQFFDNLRGIGLRVYAWRCWGAEGGGIDGLEQFNVVVGKNNSGKSSLREIVRLSFNERNQDALAQSAGALDNVIVEANKLGSKNHRVMETVEIRGRVNRELLWKGRFALNRALVHEYPVETSIQYDRTPSTSAANLLDGIHSGSYGEYFIESERDISVEARYTAPTGLKGIQIEPDGRNLTQFFDYIANNAADGYNRDPFEDFVKHLKAVLSPDLPISEFRVMDADSAKGTRTILLKHAVNSSWIPLDSLGSGIKTVIHLLALLHLGRKQIDIRSTEGFRPPAIFFLEELESHLHPAMLVRLLIHLYQTCLDEKCIVFLTTHSPVVISFFLRRKFSGVTHVIHEKGVSKTRKIEFSPQAAEVLDDLGMLASTLLQANGIIWVEGPSDRIYISKWIDLVSAGEIKEHEHYEIAMYGGSLKSHLTGDWVEDAEKKFVQLSNINRNFVLITDRDAVDEGSMGATNVALKEKFSTEGRLWITCGWTIENLLPRGLVEEELGFTFLRWEPNVNFVELIREVYPDRATKWGSSPRKVDFARNLSEKVTPEHLDPAVDPHITELRAFLDSLVMRIKKWNHL